MKLADESVGDSRLIADSLTTEFSQFGDRLGTWSQLGDSMFIAFVVVLANTLAKALKSRVCHAFDNVLSFILLLWIEIDEVFS